MDGDTPLLPEEIIINILKRLPVKSLIRFQCVCKHWKNLFFTPYFIADHLHHSTHQNPSLLFECFGERVPLNLCLLDREMQVTELLNAPLIDSMLGVQLAWIVDSSNGLLCVQLIGTSHSFILLNPAIREIRQVPKAVKCLYGEKFYVGFGFSPIVNDYKILRICSVISELVNKVEVYSLSTGLWKEVEFGNLDGVALQSNGFTANGAICWFGFKLGVKEEAGHRGHLIVSFDIATEVFTLIPMPAINLNLGTCFAVYDHKLAMLYPAVTGNLESSLIELWVMEGASASGQKWSWTKKYTSSTYPLSLIPVTIWRNEIVFRATERDLENEIRTILFNPTTNEFKMLDIRRCGRSYQIFNYVESLVPVDNNHIEEP